MLDYWMGFGVGMAWLLAAGHGLSRHKPGSRWLLVLLFFSIGLIQLAWLGVYQGWIRQWPGLLFVHQPALFLIGPSLLLYSREVRQPGAGLSPALRRHFVPAAVVALISVIQWLLHDPRTDTPQLSALLVAASAGSGGFYILPIARRLQRVQQQAPYLRVELWVLRGLMAIGFGVGLAALFTDMLSGTVFFRVYLSLITLVMVASYLLGIKYPELTHYIAERMEKTRYERSTLSNVDVDRALNELQRLMQEEALYCDDSLTLAGLAAHLDVSPHQLSEILNERLGQSFPRYLKTLRIDAARQLLREQPEETILNIGLSVGFSSSSAFYAAFREIAGMPPGQYRKQLS